MKNKRNKRNKLGFIFRYTRACTNLGFYLGQESISPAQYDRLLWRLTAIIHDYEKTL